jgi:hypothetical protein
MIFYDGAQPWTAERNFLERTHLKEVFEKYIPKFEYELINLNDYTTEQIMKFGDALSFLLLIDKIRTIKGKISITELPGEYKEKLRLQIPENMVKLITDVTMSLMAKGGNERWEAEKAAAIAEMAGKKEYGGMFEAVIESIQEGKEEAWADGRQQGLDVGRQQGLDEGRQQGLDEGRAETQVETARNALAKGLSIELVQEITGLDIEIIQSLQSEKTTSEL